MARDYKQEYAEYQGTARIKKQRARNNKARRIMIKAGRAHVGDGKDVAHLDNNTRHEGLSNLALQSKHKNRSFARTKTAARKKK